MHLMRSTLFLLFLLFSVGIFAQTEYGTCGFGTFDKTEFHKRLLRNKQFSKQNPPERAIRYVPLKYHLVGKNDKSGILNERHVLDNLNALNEAYEDVGFVFYIKDELNYVYNDFVYNDPGGSQFSVSLNKVGDAVNVFITNLATTPSGQSLGTTLGYYWTNLDVLVMRKDQVNADVGTMGHEVGHFFALDHTHNGWDVEPWDPNLHGNPYMGINTPAPNFPVKVELVDGSNCDIAGDFLCDTPADYNLGFGWIVGGDQCAPYTGGCKDRNDQLLDPDEENFMGYFINCDEYHFSNEQIAIMQSDFDNRPELINGGYVPNTAEISDDINLTYPIDSETTPAYTIIEFDWDDVDGATHYVLEVDKTPSFGISAIHAVTDKSEFTLEADLIKNFFYYWRITPFNESKGGTTSTFEKFRTGTATAVETIEGIDSWQLSPNPADLNQEIVLQIFGSQLNQDLSLRILNMNGQLQHEQIVKATTGNLRLNIRNLNLSQGFYFVELQGNKGRQSKKLFIK